MNQPCLSPRYLARHEIRRRPWQFLLSACAVAVGVAVVGGCLLALARERQSTEETLRGQERELDKRFVGYEGELAEAMTKAGFNVMILPRDQKLGDWYNEESFAARSLPKDAVERLGARPLETVEHLLPALTGRFEWPERKWTVVVRGTAPDVLHPNEMAAPILDRSVPRKRGRGRGDRARLLLEAGQELAVAGRSFRIRQCRPATGTKDDITLHLPIKAAQEVLDRPGAVNEIVGLERPKAWGDIERIRAELAARLPEARIFEISNRVVATMRARKMAERESRALLEQERVRRQRLLAAHGKMALGASLAALAVSSLWLAIMTFLNLARRRGEIGLLSALGVPTAGIRAVLLTRVAWVAGLGVILGATPWLPLGLVRLGPAHVLLWFCAATVAALPPLLATVTLLHCQLARHDPADVLKNEV